MTILIDKQTKVLVQGATGKQGSFHTKLMKEYGTNITAGVTPKKGGQEVHGIPVFNTVKEAQDNNPADYSILFVPARFAKNAAFEALENGLNLVIISEGIPIHDSIDIMNKAHENGLTIIGPNTPGILSVNECKVGIMPSHIFTKGQIGIISRSGTLTYEIVNELSRNNLGQSTVLGIGGDPIIGIDFIGALKLFEKDDGTEKIVVIGEIGGDLEERTAKFLKEYSKSVVVYIAGRTAPPDKRMGHAGAIISAGMGTAKSKIEKFMSVGIKVAQLPSEVVKLLQ
jgi:succinyl-CoA synthetase alpha subunit